jgi:hypothetical protein
MRSIILLPVVALAALFLPATGKTQITQEWAEIYYATSPGPPRVVTDPSGNVYLAGGTVTSGTGSFRLVKYNASGTEQWAATYTATPTGTVNGLGTDQSGNIYVIAGATTVKYSPAGVQQWATAAVVNGTSPNVTAATVDAAGNVYLTGDYNYNGIIDYATVKLNTAGVQQWSATYNGSANNVDIANAIAVDAAGNVYVSGSSVGQDTAHLIGIRGGSGGIFIIPTGFDIVTIKYSASGVAQWTNRYTSAGDNGDYAMALAVDPAGDVYVAGQVSGAGSVVIAYTTGGTQSWLDQNTQAAQYSGIAVDPSGNVFAAGITSYQSGIFVVRKLTPAGSVAWMSTYGSLITYSPPFLAVDKQGNAYVTAPVEAVGASNINYGTVEFTSAGGVEWAEVYNGPANGQDYANSIAVYTPTPKIGGLIEYPNIYVTGTADNGADFTTIQYYYKPVAVLSNTADSATTTPKTLAAPLTANLSNYPNPFHGATTITYNLPNDSHVTLQVYDLTGRPVAILIEENESSGPHTLSFNAGHIVPGVYQYRIIAKSPQGSFVETKQMLVQ